MIPAVIVCRVVVRKQLNGCPSLEEHQFKLLYHTISVLSLLWSSNGEPCRLTINEGNVMAALNIGHVHSNPVSYLVNIELPLAHFTGAGSID